jgi:hypothetical protein
MAVVAGLSAMGSLAACSGSDDRSIGQREAITTVTELRRTTADELGIRLDPTGRPYDAELPRGREGVTIEFEAVGELHVPDGHLRVMDGNGLEVDPWFFRDGAAAVEFGEPNEVLDLGIIWEVWPERSPGPDAPEGTPRGVLGVRLDLPGTEVARWGPFELAYGTDGGVGGITSQSTIDTAEDGWDQETHAIGYETGFTFVLNDWDGIPGDESFIFANGTGDGGFPMAQGYDADDRLVSLIVWDTRQPWRLAVTDGTPPPDVTRREEQLLGCMEGTHPIDNHGFCVEDGPSF